MDRSTSKTKEDRQREVARLQCEVGLAPPRSRAQRMRILEVLRLQVTDGDDETPVRPFGKRGMEPMDISALENEWEEGQRKFRRHLAEAGLSEDMYGRIHCGACGDWVPASTKGISGGSMRALAFWHAFFCEARKGRKA